MKHWAFGVIRREGVAYFDSLIHDVAKSAHSASLGGERRVSDELWRRANLLRSYLDEYLDDPDRDLETME